VVEVHKPLWTLRQFTQALLVRKLYSRLGAQSPLSLFSLTSVHLQGSVHTIRHKKATRYITITSLLLKDPILLVTFLTPPFKVYSMHNAFYCVPIAVMRQPNGLIARKLR